MGKKVNGEPDPNPVADPPPGDVAPIATDPSQDSKGANSGPADKSKGGPIDIETETLASLAEVHEETHDGFDPTIHAVDAEGKPLKRADGTYAKKRGRKAGSSPAGSALPSPNAPASMNAPSTNGVILTSEQVAKQIVNAGLNGAVMIFGDDWEPENISEAKALVFSLRDYFDIRGVPKFPAELGLLIAVGAYALPRLRKEKTRTKIQTWKDNVILFFAKKKAKGFE